LQKETLADVEDAIKEMNNWIKLLLEGEIEPDRVYGFPMQWWDEINGYFQEVGVLK
jgi:hypothetical protein